MKTIIFATGNEGKLREVKQILEGLPCNIISMKEAGLFVEVEEDGVTYEENAMLKAEAIAALAAQSDEYKDAIVMADDSGFEVDYLAKRPGVYSARFLGVDTPYIIKNQHILDEMKGVPDEYRSARFVAAISCVYPDGKKETVRATYEGIVAHEAKGTNGFGYDPILYLPERGCTSSELEPDEKNKISHRAKALMLVKEKLEAWL